MLKLLFYNSLIGQLGSIICLIIAIHSRNELAFWGWISATFLWLPVVLQRWKDRNDLQP